MLNETREIIDRWLTGYNRHRPHKSLNNLTSEEYQLMAEKTEISKWVCLHRLNQTTSNKT